MADSQMIWSDVVRELLLGKASDFTAVGEVTPKGFHEPVALCEVAIDEGGSGA